MRAELVHRVQGVADEARLLGLVLVADVDKRAGCFRQSSLLLPEKRATTDTLDAVCAHHCVSSLRGAVREGDCDLVAMFLDLGADFAKLQGTVSWHRFSQYFEAIPECQGHRTGTCAAFRDSLAQPRHLESSRPNRQSCHCREAEIPFGPVQAYRGDLI